MSLLRQFWDDFNCVNDDVVRDAQRNFILPDEIGGGNEIYGKDNRFLDSHYERFSLLIHTHIPNKLLRPYPRNLPNLLMGAFVC